jgi:uncharacterized protein YdeI (YjbR/CyaY-like superfamily)
MNTAVDKFLVEGCGRCKLAATPACKVNPWSQELHLLRELLMASGLEEEIKWGFPTYTLNKKNLIMLAVFKEFCSLEFFNGHLLTDHTSILKKPGENAQSGRRIEFRSTNEIVSQLEIIQATIKEAIDIQTNSPVSLVKKRPVIHIPDELLQIFKQDKTLENAFNALTPGRQRGYCLFFTGAKQTQTRISRIKKFEAKIKLGKGLND